MLHRFFYVNFKKKDYKNFEIDKMFAKFVFFCSKSLHLNRKN